MTTTVDAGIGSFERDEVVEAMAELIPICNEMMVAGLPKRFAITAMAEAVRYEGLRHLLKMWHDEQEATIRDEIVADISELLEDLKIQGVVEHPAIRHRDVAPLIEDIRAFKDALRRIVDEKGGISWLAEQTKIPQPSLSRFFNKVSMPQRGTLLKLQGALGPDGGSVIEGWLKR